MATSHVGMNVSIMFGAVDNPTVAPKMVSVAQLDGGGGGGVWVGEGEGGGGVHWDDLPKAVHNYRGDSTDHLLYGVSGYSTRRWGAALQTA